jgi:hypothetical protein
MWHYNQAPIPGHNAMLLRYLYNALVSLPIDSIAAYRRA